MSEILKHFKVLVQMANKVSFHFILIFLFISNLTLTLVCITNLESVLLIFVHKMSPARVNFRSYSMYYDNSLSYKDYKITAFSVVKLYNYFCC